MRLYILCIIALMLLTMSIAGATAIPSLTIMVYRDGEPVANAVVELWTNNSIVQRGITDANGEVIFTNITAGTYTIYVYFNGTAYEFRETIDANTTSITLNITATVDDTNDTVDDTNNTVWNVIRNNQHIAVPVAIGFIFVTLVAIAYALSGKRIPRRR